MLTVQKASLTGALLFCPDVFEDARGTFQETLSQRKYAEVGFTEEFVQTSCSVSSRGVLRGLHGDPNIAKLVTCVRGKVFDVLVDCVEGSPTYRQWEGFVLSDSNHRQVYAPRGFAHGFLALTDDAVVVYQQTAHHDPATEFTVHYGDPRIGIRWPFLPTIVSEKDANAPLPTASEMAQFMRRGTYGCA